MATYTSQPDDTTGIDTHIDSASPTSNSGADVYLATGGTQRSLLKFDFSSIGFVSYVNSATLTLTVGQASGATLQSALNVYRQKRAWVEGQATWNIYATGSNWQTAGGFGTNDCEQTSIGSVTPATNPSAGTAYNISLDTTAIKDMINGAFTNNGFLLKKASETNDRIIWASSGNTTTSYRPKLVIEYVLPSGVTAVFLSDYGVM